MVWLWIIKNLVPPAKVRRWIYGVLVAAAPLLVLYGIAEKAEIAIWIAVLSSALGHGMAAVKVPQED